VNVSNRVPPPWFRLLVLTPIVFVGSAVVTVLSPLLHLVLLLVDLVDRRRMRFSRIGGLGIALCVLEFAGLLVAFALWVGSGFGLGLRTRLFRRAHNRAFGWYLELFTRALRFYLGFTFSMPVGERVDGPVVTFARHAGPGDAFLLARLVIRDYHRQLRMLGTTKLLWDPFIDHMLRRMPYHFCDQNPADATADLASITEMCASMDDDGVVIIFPEGGNWTPNRWVAAIERLESRGLHERARRAAGMPNVLAPRSAGAVAALRARSDVTVVFVVHAGLADLFSLREIWRKIPLRRRVVGTYWVIQPSDVPSDPSEISPWLFDQWERVDRWIEEHRPEVTQA
jgi:1-acyl-sn-glycerol-3-phosphate acyltransferase